jgi:hypothetical protein
VLQTNSVLQTIYLDKVDRMLKRKLEPQLEEVPEGVHLKPVRPKVVAAE